MKLKFLLVLFFVFLFGFGMARNVKASLDSGVPCDSTSDCVEEFGDGHFCKNDTCHYSPQTAGTWQKPTLEEISEDAYEEEPNSINFIFHFFNGFVGAASDSLIALNNSEEDGTAQTGAAFFFTENIAYMIGKPPARTATYIADVANDAGFVDSAYAQDGSENGTGWRALMPVLKVWKAFRNVSYLFLVVIFVIIGFMIMFRSKIGGQTVVTIQAAIPNIALTMLIITFSYAIASFVLDIIYLLIYLIIEIFEMFGIINPGGSAKVEDIIMGDSLWKIWNSVVGGGWNGMAGTASDAVMDIVKGMLGIVGETAIETLELVSGFNTSSLAYLIIAIAITISLFKMFFKLLMAYISIILSVIFAPILLLFNALPGSQSFSKWIKGLLSNALLFPVTALMIIIAAALTGNSKFQIADGIGYQDSNFEDVGLPLIARGVDTEAMMGLIAIGFLMMIPSMLEMVQKALGVEGGLSGMAQSIVAPIQSGWNVVSTPFRMTGGLARNFGGSVMTAATQEWWQHRGDKDPASRVDGAQDETNERPGTEPSPGLEVLDPTSDND